MALLWSRWYLGLPVFYALAVSLTAGVENTAHQSPTTALGISIHGRNTLSARLLRIALTPPLLLPGLVGFLNCFRGGLSLPEALSGTDFRELDLQLDPRPKPVIRRSRSVAKAWVRAYTSSAIIASAGIFILASPLSVEEEGPDREIQQTREMSSSDRQLLALYLELSALHPDELEYHVRLASLYHRNAMHEDLQNQLKEIARLNPDHAFLVLAEPREVSFDDLLAPPEEDVQEEPVLIRIDRDTTEAAADSLAAAESEPETAVSDSIPLPEPFEEPLEAIPDTMAIPDEHPEPFQPDSL